MKKKEYLNNININYGTLNSDQIAEIDTTLDYIENNLPNLFSTINDIALEATKIHGPITIKFWRKLDIDYDKYAKFGASWLKSEKMINIDFYLDIYDLVGSIFCELHNACNRPLNDDLEYMTAMPYIPDLTDEQVNEMALKSEELEFSSHVETQKVLYNYLLNNEAEITPLLQQYGESYQELLTEIQESLNDSFDDHKKLFEDNTSIASSHKKSYESIIRYNNKIKGRLEETERKLKEHEEWDLNFKKQQLEYEKEIKFTIAKAEIRDDFFTKLEQKYKEALSNNNEKIKNNLCPDEVIARYNLDLNNLEVSLDIINWETCNKAKDYINLSIMYITPEEFENSAVLGKVESYVDSIKFISL